MTEKKQLPRGISSFGLHIFAMACMVLDHMWATVIPGQQWMNIAGRLSFPIFAFLISEGFHYTRNVDKYIQRMFLWALISEIPFNLMYEGTLFYPFGQNVMFTFWLSLLCLRALKRQSERRQGWKLWLVSGLIIGGFQFLGDITFVDYHGEGILMVVLFWIFRGDTWVHKQAQGLGMWYINFEMYRGQNLLIPAFVQKLEIPLQGFAILALLPVWLYHGRQGPHNKTISFIFYGFYPVHMLILALLMLAR